MVYISFLISHVPPAHSFFQKKSILINLTQNLVQLIFKRILKKVGKVLAVFSSIDVFLFLRITNYKKNRQKNNHGTCNDKS